MPFDREGTLRKAEKLLRQGKLDLAIVEYRSVIEAEPSDWSTANTLGDLYVRAKQTDKAIVEFIRIADHLADEGFVPKAVAVYRKILKIKPDDERAMWQLGTIATRQGLLVDARAQFTALVERRKANGDRRGEAEARVRLGQLDGAPLAVRLAGVRARVELGETEQAVAQFKEIAADLHEKGEQPQALEALLEAIALAPDEAELKSSLTAAYIARGDFDAARRYATTGPELKGLSDRLRHLGRAEEAMEVLAAAAGVDPSDTAVRTELATAYLAQGEKDKARALLSTDVPGDIDLLWTLAEMELREGRTPEGTTIIHEILAVDPSRVNGLVILGCGIGESDPDTGYECIEIAARAAIGAGEWASAAAALNEFVHRVPNYIPALMQLVEICVDGGLEATMNSAQAQLADAYLVIGSGAEARVIAEDLVAREPWNRANIERFRRALTLLGENDIDAIIAERLSGQSPFVSTDNIWVLDSETSGDISELANAADDAAATAMPPTPEPLVVQDASDRADVAPVPNPALHAIDLSGLVEEHEAAVAEESHEVDLSDMFGATTGAKAPVDTSIEGALKRVRDEALPDDGSVEAAEEQFKLATSYIAVSMVDEAIKALELASKSLGYRFRAGAMLANLYGQKGDRAHAVEWFERAAEAPAPSRAASHQLMYELAGALEANGEPARALAILLELQSEAGDYRDVGARLENLMGSSKIQ